MLVQQGKHLFGNAIFLFRPFLQFIEFIRFNKVSHFTSIGGVNSCDIPILAIHSKDDPIVYFENSLVSKKLQCTNPNAVFITLDGCKHNVTLSQNARNYGAELKASIKIPRHINSQDEIEKYLINIDKMRLYELDMHRMKFIENFIVKAL